MNQCPYYDAQQGICTLNKEFTCYGNFKYCDIHSDWLEREKKAKDVPKE